jgi:hypothetical protein
MIELSCSPTIQMSIRIHCHIPTCSTTYGLSTGSSIFWLFSMCALATTARKSLFQLFSGSSATNHDTTKYGKWTKRCCHWKYGRNSIRHPAGGHNGNHYGCVISVGLLFPCSRPATGFDSFTDEQLMWPEGPQLREFLQRLRHLEGFKVSAIVQRGSELFLMRISFKRWEICAF